jgi:septal ring factor EnvC (AmiA/AmiB activator)
MAEEYNIDVTGLTPEIADQIKKLTDDYKQTTANLSAITENYNKKDEELKKAKEDITALKAANMALALTGGVKKQSVEEILSSMFDLGGE